MSTASMREGLERRVRDELFRLHEVCPQCEIEASSSTRTGCPVVDEFAVDRVIEICRVGFIAMEAAAEHEQRFIVSR